MLLTSRAEWLYGWTVYLLGQQTQAIYDDKERSFFPV
ncbi:hypothetical protein EDC28_1026 [Gallaecimonas pentaromativorans]|uniref:Uncharacterized protein n=1 Tax=Gallaecimonas pentaromativorans TaxID=584787 RepID=A0A3N1PDV4_9GAMM|nr:hypothetical protein EDC28_1026 [Gallaecimonas pentaromativorans]